MSTPETIIDAYHDAIPLNRYSSEEEIANLIVSLCSKEARDISRDKLLQQMAGLNERDLGYLHCVSEFASGNIKRWIKHVWCN